MLAPKVSVLMAAFNAEQHLCEAVDSILAQTFVDFEFIIVDDGSTDGTATLLDSYSDARIVRLRNESNIGLTRSLNRGLAVAAGDYVARMDADDISAPERLQRQAAYLDVHPHVGLLGSAFAFVDEAGAEKQVFAPPTQPTDLMAALLVQNQLCHGSVMCRKCCVKAVGGYRDVFRYAQDYDLWLRLTERCEAASLGEVLYRYRVTPRGISVAKVARQDAFNALAQRCAQQRRLGIPEDLSAAGGIAESGQGDMRLLRRIAASRAMAGYHVRWGRQSLARHAVREARHELFLALRQFPLAGAAWLYLGASLMGARLLSLSHRLIRAWRIHRQAMRHAPAAAARPGDRRSQSAEDIDGT